jgi:putative ABC transport system substrate-binding protein
VSAVVVLLAVSFSLLGCQRAPVARVGLLSEGSPSTLDAAVLSGLSALGYVEGRNLVVERRYASGQPDRLPDLAADLVRLQLRVIVADGVAAARAAHGATRSIPIVSITGDPVESGLVASLDRPGGNVTGVSTSSRQASGRRLELLKLVVRDARRIKVILNPDDPSEFLEWKASSLTAGVLGVDLEPAEVRSVGDLEETLTRLTRAGTDAIIVQGDALMMSPAGTIVEHLARSRIPAIGAMVDFAHAGGLMAFGPNLSGLHRRAATHVDRILRGRDPATLPIGQPGAFELVVNVTTAQALDLPIPPSFLLTAKTVTHP